MPRVDSKGRVTLPAELRERLGLTEGTEIEFREEDGEIVVKPEEDAGVFFERHERLVAEAAENRTDPTSFDELTGEAREFAEDVRKGAKRHK